MSALRSILCPIDFSEQSRHALQWARVLARRTKSRLTVLSAVDPLLADAASLRYGLDLVHAETEPALRQFAAETWSDELADAPMANFDVRVGHSADVSLETASRERSDLIVMGTHGLGGVRKWLLFIEDADRARVADARAQLERLTQQCAESGEPESVVESGCPADSIASIADHRRAFVIVMGLASSQGPFGSRPGSIAYRVLSLAKAPVLVVPPEAVTP